MRRAGRRTPGAPRGARRPRPPGPTLGPRDIRTRHPHPTHGAPVHLRVRLRGPPRQGLRPDLRRAPRRPSSPTTPRAGAPSRRCARPGWSSWPARSRARPTSTSRTSSARRSTEIGYTDPVLRFDAQSCGVLTSIHAQSPDIAQGVDDGAGLHGEQGGRRPGDDVRVRDPRGRGDAHAARPHALARARPPARRRPQGLDAHAVPPARTRKVR